VIRLKIICEKFPDKHAKVLEMHRMKRRSVKVFAGLLCGDSPYYIHKPGALSPIGKCATCGGKLRYDIEEREEKKGPGAGV